MKGEEVMLQKGWNIYVISWEKDADSYNHLTVNVGEDEQAARNTVAFLYDIATSGYGQSLNDAKRVDIGVKFGKFFEANRSLFPGWEIQVSEWNSTIEEEYYDAFIEWIYDFVGSGDVNNAYDLRVIDSIKLTYIPVDIDWEDYGSNLYLK